MGFVISIWAVVWLLCSGLQCLLCETEGFWEDSSNLHCGLTSLQFSLPSLDEDAAFVLTVLDNHGKSHYLHNSSACGTWVGQRPDGSVVIGAAYDGCYVRQEEEDYVMTILLEEALINGHVHRHKKDLKCPMMLAMDAPSPDVCSSVQQTDRLSCANAPVTRDTCEGLGCCFNPTDPAMPCYYGNKLTAQCTADSQAVVAISGAITRPSLILDSVKLLTVNTATCPGLGVNKNNAFIVYQFPLSCGSFKVVDASTVMYENQFEATKDVRSWQGASITRDSTMKLTVRCSYSTTGVVPLQVQVFTLAPPLPVSTTGPLFLEMRIAQDPQYSSYYADEDYPLVKVLREPVFLEVRILRRTDPNLVLVLNECWATQSADPNKQPEWPILTNGCPFIGDNYLTEMIPVGSPSQTVPIPSYYQRFIVSTFTFVDGSSQQALGGLVYFHCSATVCVPSAFDNCIRTCNQRLKRMADTWAIEESVTSIVTSDGPIEFTDERIDYFISDVPDHSFWKDGMVSNLNALDWGVGAAAVGAILVVVLIVLALWRWQRSIPKEYSITGVSIKMGVSVRGWVVGVLLSISLQCLVWGAQGYLEEPFHLRCGLTSLQFVLPAMEKNIPLALTVLGRNGTLHDLHNSSACGTWIGQKPGGSVVIGAAYDGCYVREEEGDYVMTIGLEEGPINGYVQHHKKDLKCPIMPVMDAPSPDVCSAVQRADRLSCANPPITRDSCQGLGCCFNPADSTMPCYYGNKLTAQCTADSQAIVAIAGAITRPSLILDSVKLLTVNTATCPGSSVRKNNAFIVYQFPLSCGSSNQVDANTLIYENQFEATRDVRTWQGASITRDSTMRLTVRCSYTQTGVVPLQVQVFTLPPPLPVSTTGPLFLEMRIAKDPQYGSYYADGDYPVVKVLRDPVFLEVRILRRTDPNLVLVLNECWATPSADPNQQPEWPILTNSCPFTGDNYLTRMIPVGAPSQTVPIPSYYQRFAISTFTFVGGSSQQALGGLVYFHCSATVCVPSTFDSCVRTCGQRQKRMAEQWTEESSLTTVTSDGPVDFINADLEKVQTITGNLDSSYTDLFWAKAAAVAGGILVVLLVLGLVWKHHRNQNLEIYTIKI
ncbi:uncharacterized protein O3C94_008380 [Discoglossus pictus]